MGFVLWRPLATFIHNISQRWPQLRFTHPNFILLFLSISISIVLPAKGLDEQYHACGRGVGPRQFDWWCLKPHARLQLMHAYAVSTFGAHRHAVEIFNSPCPMQLRFWNHHAVEILESPCSWDFKITIQLRFKNWRLLDKWTHKKGTSSSNSISCHFSYPGDFDPPLVDRVRWKHEMDMTSFLANTPNTSQ